jgi:hypothetical protein
MTDDFEDRLRDHLAGQAARVRVEPDPSAFVEHSAGRSRRRGVVAGGVAAITILAAGAGILTGVNLGGATSAAQPQTSAPTAGPGRAGADLAPAGSGGQVPPSVVFQTPYSFLFARVSSSGVTIRTYTAGSTTTGGCGPAVVCSPTTTVPLAPTCPTGAECAQPIVTPHTSGGTTGSSNPSGPGVAVPGTSAVTPASPPSQPVGSGTTGSGSTGSGTTGSGTSSSGPPSTAAGCEPLVVELSTDEAVGTGSVSLPATATTSPSTVEVLGTGSFGTAEGAPVGWVAVRAGSGVASVQLSVGGAAVDAMAPDSGIVVLAASGIDGLAGASVVGLDPSGASVDSVPVGQAATPDGVAGCPDPISNPPTTPSTTTTVPGGPTPTPTTTTSTTTTVNGAPVPVPTDRPATTPAG